MIGASERSVSLSVFYILLCVNRLLVVIAWAFFLAMWPTTMSLDVDGVFHELCKRCISNVHDVFHELCRRCINNVDGI